ncbi:hypothetical protein [Chelatococcus reniformis]|uniref:Uncharacterized protein n=1 Tax=Chelatococcus reniformis TaxID=1494448 RepID=A0A916XD43_9HYPH|nr:hypothetical protein [Chelatococcus reniformis]GGC61799.1 hypothetical protein GCM10010994_20500 [Chelatococcus reniformis]
MRPACVSVVLLMMAPAALACDSSSPCLYSKEGKFLGHLNKNPYDPDSVANPHGRYGSPYSPDSINNPNGRYGSPYSADSANNPYATGGIVIRGR